MKGPAVTLRISVVAAAYLLAIVAANLITTHYVAAGHPEAPTQPQLA